MRLDDDWRVCPMHLLEMFVLTELGVEQPCRMCPLCAHDYREAQLEAIRQWWAELEA